MKRIVIALLFSSSVVFGAVTEAQVDQANACAKAIFDCATDLLRYTQSRKALFTSGFTLQIPGTTTVVTIPQSQQDAVIDVTTYQAKKAACAEAYNTCP